jgi:hypothetical protein
MKILQLFVYPDHQIVMQITMKPYKPWYVRVEVSGVV